MPLPSCGALSAATHFAIRLPSGQLSSDRIEIPETLRIDDSSSNLLDLIGDVSRLAKVDLLVPEHVSDEMLQDLLVARRLLTGQEVRGTWRTGSLELVPGPGLDLFRRALQAGTRHEFVTVSELSPELLGGRIPLGKVQQQLSDTEVVSITERGDVALVELRAHEGEGLSVMRPLSRRIEPLDPHVTLAPDALAQMLSDEDDGGESRLRALL
ncbi:MAG: hypothetical protein ACJ74O_02380 [Frankiaceae bacterium]